MQKRGTTLGNMFLKINFEFVDKNFTTAWRT